MSPGRVEVVDNQGCNDNMGNVVICHLRPCLCQQLGLRKQTLATYETRQGLVLGN